MKSAPPKLALRFFRWYCRNQLQETIEGDLLERFKDDLNSYGFRRAAFKYWLNVFLFINRHTLNKKSESQVVSSNHFLMIFHYLKTSIRYLRRHLSYAGINIIGLATGMSSCLLIFFFVQHELSFDRFHTNGDNIYRINIQYTDNSGNQTHFINSPPALSPGIQGLFPEMVASVRLRYALRSLMGKGDKNFYENHVFYADSTFLEIFSFPLAAGNAATALDDPNSVVLTRDMAIKYFGHSDVIGELITMNDGLNLKITGVMEDVPSNSHLRFDFLVSFSTYTIPPGYVSDLSSWRWLGFVTYVRLKESSEPEDLKTNLDQLFLEKAGGRGTPYQVSIQPLHQIYFGSTGMVDDLASYMKGGNELNLYVLVTIALLILCIAAFNFTNLSIAIAVNRGMEIGLRKVLGASRLKVKLQVLTESVLVAILSMMLSYLMMGLAFPFIKDLLQWDLVLGWSELLRSVPVVLLVAIFIGVLAGFYPSTLLSGFQTIGALKGNLKVGKGAGSRIRNILVVVQFCVSIGLIASTMVVLLQLDHLRGKSPGFNKENVMMVKLLPEHMTQYYRQFKDMLLQQTDVKSVSRSERLIGDPWPVNSILIDGQDRSNAKQVVGNLVDFDYLQTLGIKLKEGRAFSQEFATDSLRSIILNERAVQLLELDEPLGKKLRFFSLDGPRTVIGVVEDFNFSSFHHEISPAVFIMPFIDLEHLYVRVAPGNLIDRINLLEETWQAVAPGIPLDIRFMDDHLNQLYENEERLSHLIIGFSVLAVVLACLGLYGLVAFIVNNRLKEVGVRKVLGASVVSILLIFSRRFIIFVVLASLITTPFIQYALNLWLSDFAYRITIPWWVHVLSALALMIIAFFTISHQTVKAALTNPVQILRSE